MLFYSIFRTTPEVSSKPYFVEICEVSEKLWLFNHKRADFWLPNFRFKRSLLSLLKTCKKGKSINFFVNKRLKEVKVMFLIEHYKNEFKWCIITSYIEETPDTNISDTSNELKEILVHNCF